MHPGTRKPPPRPGSDAGNFAVVPSLHRTEEDTGMTRKGKAGWAAAALVAGLGGATSLAAPADGRWIHIRVVDGDDRQTNVKVNMPLSALITMADSIEDDHFKDGHVTIGHEGIDAAKLREAWQSVRNAKDMNFITVESDDETVKVAKSGRFMIAHVHDSRNGKGADGEQVQVRVPLEVVDALLDAPDGQFNVKSALEALAAQHTGDLVTVTDGSSRVRIWIDDKADPE
jgi:hypothetical protein